MTQISISELKDLSQRALLKAGLRAGDVDIIVDHYVENECSGKSSHGIVRVIETARAVNKYGIPEHDPEIIQDQNNTLICDAKAQFGPIAGSYALNIALQKSRNHSISLCGIRNIIGNTGSMAYYLRRFTAQNLIAIIGCNSVALVAPPGGKKRMIGTNPFGIGIPSSNGNHFIADFATSAIAYGKIMVAKDKGQPLPEGVLIDQDGNPSTKAEDAYDGAILPLADYRGFALGLMIELLAGPLLGAKACKQELYDNDGLFMIVINPKKIGQDSFAAQITASLNAIRDSGTRPGHNEITLPGERSARALQNAIKKGYIDIVDQTLQKLKALSE